MTDANKEIMSIKVGLIGLDTSHVTAFAEIFKTQQVPGAQVVCGFPGGSPDFDLSINRVAGYTKRLTEEFGVTILASPAAVAEQADLVFLTSVDGRVHYRQFAEIVKFKKPTFIDKPFTTTIADAQAIIDLSAKTGVPIMSASALRYVDNFQAALTGDADQGRIVGIDTYGPMELHDSQPGLFWYGIHGIEMIVAALGVGCRRVQAMTTDEVDLISFQWSDGRSATYRGSRKAHNKFGAVVHRQKVARQIDVGAAKRPMTVCLLEAILRTLPAGKTDVPVAETLEIVRVICAANESRKTGHAVNL